MNTHVSFGDDGGGGSGGFDGAIDDERIDENYDAWTETSTKFKSNLIIQPIII